MRNRPRVKPWKERGLISTSEYIAWRNIRKRCYNQKYDGWSVEKALTTPVNRAA